MKVTVNSPGKNRISINNQNRESIRVGAVGSGAATNLSNLTDVDVSDADQNETLVYDEASGKFVAKVLPIIEGGTF